MNKTIRREINALHRIGVRCRDATTSFYIIPFVYAGPRTDDGKRVVYIDGLEWYAAKSDQSDLMYENCLFPDIWEMLMLRATFYPGCYRATWKMAYREIRCVLGDRTQEGYSGIRKLIFEKARDLVESELLAEATA
ncbi:hypothetical protein ONE84_000894 [Salmonella enterica subsp. enterica serovar Newport]|uniref:Uncharacterized protein n=2 Tax=Salmonella enterica TaxID=28901 RepID=A0A5Y2FIG8_SALNE|nr:hypothetical protein [Salmonella enterica subsp. salamae]ECD6074541.1 hypothetical protein [Salmonella enterica subsp. enterica serovar Newport]SUF69580.1 Uncharacterised protein [Salmonella enterica]EDV1420505.1 hypothetical protein [Salmonella enterica subsp. salamae]EJE2205284.1 hypothetical protein [Salmonella enterica subsp. enterica serovar Newport]